jgi:hypothetical protein
MPITKKITLHMKDANHTVLLTETCGLFSLIQEGTVVTKPKLKSTVPSTPACEAQPPWAEQGALWMAGHGRCVSIFLDKNRRHVGKSRSKRPPKRTKGHRTWDVPACGRCDVVQAHPLAVCGERRRVERGPDPDEPAPHREHKGDDLHDHVVVQVEVAHRDGDQARDLPDDDCY